MRNKTSVNRPFRWTFYAICLLVAVALSTLFHHLGWGTAVHRLSNTLTIVSVILFVASTIIDATGVKRGETGRALAFLVADALLVVVALVLGLTGATVANAELSNLASATPAVDASTR